MWTICFIAHAADKGQSLQLYYTLIQIGLHICIDIYPYLKYVACCRCKSAGVYVQARLVEDVMAVDFNVIVSSENSAYMAWQTQLFCFSALTRLGKHPTVVVHRAGTPLRPEFSTVSSWGCPVIEAPQFWHHPKGEYPPRNELGTLLTIASLPKFAEGHVLFCEADMLFVKRLVYSGELSGEHYSYMDYREKRVHAVARKFGIADRLDGLNETGTIGVPYLIPCQHIPRIARRWIDVLDSFDELQWIDIMYAFGLALAVEGLPAKSTQVMAHNYDPLSVLNRDLIHYCYGDWRWDKRAFREGHSPLGDAPIPSRKGLSGTVLGEIFNQIRQARAYSRCPWALKAVWRLAAAVSS
jgi:hypothetical protein